MPAEPTAGDDPAVSDLELVAELATEFLELPSDRDVYVRLASGLRQVIGEEAIISVSNFDPECRMFRPQAIEGLGPILERILSLIGTTPMDLVADYPPAVRQVMTSGRLTRIEGGVVALAGDVLPHAIIRQASALFGLEDVFVVGFTKRSFSGGVCIVTRRPGLTLRSATLETLVRVAASALDRRRVEAELRASQDQLAESLERLRLQSLVLDQIQDQVTVTDLQGQITYVNQAQTNKLGHQLEELRGASVEAFGEDPEQGATQREIIQSTLRDGAWRGEVVNFTKAGGRIVMDCRTRVVRDASGAAIALCGIATDITDRMRAAAALKESQARSQALLDALPDLMFVIDRDGVYVDYHAPEAAQLLAPPEAFLGRRVRDVLPADLASQALEHIQDIVRTGRTAPYEYQLELHGVQQFYECRMVACGDRNVLAMVRNVTERVSTDGALRESEAKLRFVTESIKDVIWTLDAETLRFLYVSPTVERLRGFTPDEVRSAPLDAALTPEAVTRVRELIAQRARISEEAEREGRIDFYTEEVAQPCKDGSVVVTEVTTSFRLNPGTGRLEVHGVTRDITERKRAEEERSRLEAQLLQAQRMESVGRLAGGVAHDFNNMLGVILGHAELALELASPGHPIRENLEAIQAAATRSAGLTRQLLAFARKQTVTPREIDLDAAVAGTLQMLARLIGEDIHLLWRPGPCRWSLRVDPAQLDQILTNLCVNARDAIADVGTITIETGTRVIDEAHATAHPDATPGEYVWLSVRDDGSGMAPETLAHLFEPFFTTKPVGKGTGLGLATVYGIVRQNAGFVEVASEPGQGSTFAVFLPRHTGRAADAAEEAAPAGGPGLETILLVEDEPSIRKLTETLLRRLGYTVIATGTPGEALALARAHRGDIQLLLTDVVMPEMNGHDLASRLLTIFPGIRRLFMSGYTADVIAHHGVLEEGVCFLQKPFTLHGLALMVRKALGGS